MLHTSENSHTLICDYRSKNRFYGSSVYLFALDKEYSSERDNLFYESVDINPWVYNCAEPVCWLVTKLWINKFDFWAICFLYQRLRNSHVDSKRDCSFCC